MSEIDIQRALDDNGHKIINLEDFEELLEDYLEEHIPSYITLEELIFEIEERKAVQVMEMNRNLDDPEYQEHLIEFVGDGTMGSYQNQEGELFMRVSAMDFIGVYDGMWNMFDDSAIQTALTHAIVHALYHSEDRIADRLNGDLESAKFGFPGNDPEEERIAIEDKRLALMQNPNASKVISMRQVKHIKQRILKSKLNGEEFELWEEFNKHSLRENKDVITHLVLDEEMCNALSQQTGDGSIGTYTDPSNRNGRLNFLSIETLNMIRSLKRPVEGYPQHLIRADEDAMEAAIEFAGDARKYVAEGRLFPLSFRRG